MRRRANAIISNGYPIDVSIILLHVERSVRMPYRKGSRSVLSKRVNRNSPCSDPKYMGSAHSQPWNQRSTAVVKHALDREILAEAIVAAAGAVASVLMKKRPSADQVPRLVKRSSKWELKPPLPQRRSLRRLWELSPRLLPKLQY
jgi:hypothetical protein